MDQNTIMKMTGTVEIKNLRIKAAHGVFPQERIVGNIFEVSLKICYPMAQAMLHDSLHGTISYADVIELVKTIMKQPVQLLEHVAYNIRRALLETYPQITGGDIRVAKIQPPVAAELDEVAVTIPF